MVRIDVPILHSPNDVDATIVIIKNILQMISFIPIIIPLVAAKTCPYPCCEGTNWSNRVVTAHAHIVLRRICCCTFVKDIIQHCSSFRGTITIEHLLNSNRARYWNDSLEMWRWVLSGFPISGSRIGLAHQSDISI